MSADDLQSIHDRLIQRPSPNLADAVPVARIPGLVEIPADEATEIVTPPSQVAQLYGRLPTFRSLDPRVQLFEAFAVPKAVCLRQVRAITQRVEMQ
jgi:hypothetical protein